MIRTQKLSVYEKLFQTSDMFNVYKLCCGHIDIMLDILYEKLVTRILKLGNSTTTE